MEGRARSSSGRRWPPRALAIALLAAGTIVAAAPIDYGITSSALPELDPSAPQEDPDLVERERLGDGYETRGWFYALGLLLVIVGLVVIAVRAGAEGRRERFADLGVAGVVIGIVTWIVVAQEPTLLADDGGESAIWIPTVALLLSAGVGTVLSRRPEARTPPPAVALVAVGLAALTVLLVIVGHSDRGCGEPAPAWSDAVLWLGFATGVAAALLGIAALFARRWLAALVSIPAPVVGLFSIIAAACLN